MQVASHHTFHIPVMGLAFTIDTPVKVARFGINSVISIIEDNLVEKMRSYYYSQLGERYQPITSSESDFRARRITDYLNLVNRIVKKQIEELKCSPFERGSEICKYFEMLPEKNGLKDIYRQMMTQSDPKNKAQLKNWLRQQIVPGSIDVNIMTKLDKDNFDKRGHAIEHSSDAVAALRGYAMSNLLNSSVVFSAGMNPRLFSYMDKFNVFDADNTGCFQKKIVIKVSDYRSALIQGKMLAKKGLWVSEFRIESGLNCGGHAFVTDGFLLGPILQEFKDKKHDLATILFDLYNQGLTAKGKSGFQHVHPLKITVQGGIGTFEEDEFLRKYYGVDGTGWGTPFLLVPEATNVDVATLQLLSHATDKDITLSKNSPLGVRFYYLRGTSGENEKQARILRGVPGSPCTEKYLVSNTEFTKEPICTASHTYQKRKIEQLQSMEFSDADYKRKLHEVLAKECLCIGLSNSVVKNYRLKSFKKLEAVTICPGPNIVYFTKIVSLQKMLDHIYGRSTIVTAANRPHMFIKELMLYIDFWEELLQEERNYNDTRQKHYLQVFHQNLMEGIAYYRSLCKETLAEAGHLRIKLMDGLNEAEQKLNTLFQNLFGSV